MKLVVAGGTGFLGRPLCEAWAEDGHEVIVLTRSLPPAECVHEAGTGVPGVTRCGWVPDGQLGPWVRLLDGADAVVNLAGESIAGGRWTTARKALLRESRLLPTRSLTGAFLAAPSPPAVFVSGSAVGYYGSAGADVKTERSEPGRDFLGTMCVEWEQEAARAARPGTRVVLIRTGLVLERDGGVLPPIARPVRLFIGGRVGSGRQYMSWIHRLDWIELVRWAVSTASVNGPLNATAPQPVTNAEFMRALGRVLRRPTLLPAPAFALRMLFGEMADALLLGGQRVVPARSLEQGFYFRYPELDLAFRAVYQT